MNECHRVFWQNSCRRESRRSRHKLSIHKLSFVQCYCPEEFCLRVSPTQLNPIQLSCIVPCARNWAEDQPRTDKDEDNTAAAQGSWRTCGSLPGASPWSAQWWSGMALTPCSWWTTSVWWYIIIILVLHEKEFKSVSYVYNNLEVGQRGSCCDLCWGAFCLCISLGVLSFLTLHLGLWSPLGLFLCVVCFCV